MNLFIAILPDYPSIPQTIGYQVTGLAVVFIALGSLWALMELMGAIFRAKAARESAATAADRVSQPQLSAAPPALSSEIAPAHLIAAITAAVHIALEGRPHKIVSIQTPSTAAAWSAEGRRDVFVSHRVR